MYHSSLTHSNQRWSTLPDPQRGGCRHEPMQLASRIPIKTPKYPAQKRPHVAQPGGPRGDQEAARRTYAAPIESTSAFGVLGGTEERTPPQKPEEQLSPQKKARASKTRVMPDKVTLRFRIGLVVDFTSPRIFPSKQATSSPCSSWFLSRSFSTTATEFFKLSASIHWAVRSVPHDATFSTAGQSQRGKLTQQTPKPNHHRSEKCSFMKSPDVNRTGFNRRSVS